MNYYIIIRPLIGAFTGYITNLIAVKMMFRPLKPIKLGNFKLPFTPGIIPKNQEKLATSIGNIISKDLLNEETLKETLLSDDFENKILNKVNSHINDNTMTFENLICSYVDKEKYNNILNNLKCSLSKSIYNSILESNLSDSIADQIEIAAKEKIKGSVLGILGGNSLINSLKSNISIKIDEYLENNGEHLINDLIEKELNKLNSKSIKELSNNINLNNIIIEIYENYIIEKIPQILNTLNISKIITDKINSMDVLELEKLILSIMKKELNALVNLGALIGFLLGLLNLII